MMLYENFVRFLGSDGCDYARTDKDKQRVCAKLRALETRRPTRGNPVWLRCVLPAGTQRRYYKVVDINLRDVRFNPPESWEPQTYWYCRLVFRNNSAHCYYDTGKGCWNGSKCGPWSLTLGQLVTADFLRRLPPPSVPLRLTKSPHGSMRPRGRRLSTALNTLKLPDSWRAHKSRHRFIKHLQVHGFWTPPVQKLYDTFHNIGTAFVDLTDDQWLELCECALATRFEW